MPGKKRNPYEGERKPIEADKSPEGPKNRPDSYSPVHEKGEKEEMVTFSVQLPKSQRDALDKFLWEEKGLKRSSFIRQLITEYMRKERIW
jgi:hypothetical protein